MPTDLTGRELDRRVAEAMGRLVDVHPSNGLMACVGDFGDLYELHHYSTAPGPWFDEMLAWLCARPGAIQVEMHAVVINDDGQCEYHVGLRDYEEGRPFPDHFTNGLTIYEAVARLVVAVGEREGGDA